VKPRKTIPNPASVMPVFLIVQLAPPSMLLKTPKALLSPFVPAQTIAGVFGSMVRLKMV
jgi:hypothetical protein